MGCDAAPNGNYVSKAKVIPEQGGRCCELTDRLLRWCYWRIVDELGFFARPVTDFGYPLRPIGNLKRGAGG
jgi:hypothetical protein